MAGMKNVKTAPKSELQKQWGIFLAVGILMVIFGFMIVVFPVAGTLTIDFLIGILVLIAGLSQIVLAFKAKKWTGFLVTLILGIIYGIAGLFLLFNPLAGVVTLTLVLGIFLLIDGLFRIILAFTIRRQHDWEWLVFGGIVSIILGILILMSWPGDSAVILGLLFGISMIMGGVVNIVLSLAVKDMK